MGRATLPLAAPVGRLESPANVAQLQRPQLLAGLQERNHDQHEGAGIKQSARWRVINEAMEIRHGRVGASSGEDAGVRLRPTLSGCPKDGRAPGIVTKSPGMKRYRARRRHQCVPCE